MWSRHPAGTTYTVEPWESGAFYEDMRSTRYRIQPWHPSLLASLSGHRLLEVGCGAGTDLAVLGGRSGGAIGVDLTFTGARLGRGALRHWGVPGATVVADGQRLPFREGAFDLAYSFGVIHHTDHPDEVVAEIRRVLAPGGRVVIGLYHRWSAHTFLLAAWWLASGRFRREPFEYFVGRREGGAEKSDRPPRALLYTERAGRSLLGEFRDVRARTFLAGPGRPLPRPVERALATVHRRYLVLDGIR